jgi:hypothetical protein
VSANPNTGIAFSCLLINQAGSSDSAANGYGFKTSALPSSNPGAWAATEALWLAKGGGGTGQADLLLVSCLL